MTWLLDLAAGLVLSVVVVLMAVGLVIAVVAVVIHVHELWLGVRRGRAFRAAAGDSAPPASAAAPSPWTSHAPERRRR